MSDAPGLVHRVYRRRAGWPHAWLVGALCLVCWAAGCTADSSNAAFPVTGSFIDAEWARLAAAPRVRAEPAQGMAEEPPGRVLDRPLVVLGGYRSPAVFAGGVASDLRRLTGAPESEVLAVGYPFEDNFASLSRAVVNAIEQRWPSDDPARTVEVDVVGISMGGLVARAAAASPQIPSTFSGDEPPLGPSKALRIRRLFTLATPHRGALLAGKIALDPMSQDMKPGSGFLAALHAQLPGAPYELICYARTRDDIVGASNAAPPGRHPIWVEGPLFFGHHSTPSDRRFLVDIARRLRGEEPLAREDGPPPRD